MGVHDPDLDRWCPRCGADCARYSPQHAPWCPAVTGLDVAVGGESCVRCHLVLVADEPYEPTPDDHAPAGIKQLEVVCLSCAAVAAIPSLTPRSNP